MSGLDAGLKVHLETGATTTCRAWALSRRDGVVMGFTDHDETLEFEGITFRADTGLSALALQQSTGLSVDNTEALGALSDAAIREEDIEAGRYDGAEVRAWLVNWADVAQRHLQFRGTIGELRRAGGAFQAELRGLTDLLNVPMGRVYQSPCSAILGDGDCGLDLAAGWSVETVLAEGGDRRVLHVAGLETQAPGWFRHGVVTMLDGAAEGLTGVVKEDRIEGDQRQVELWHPMRAAVAPGDALRLTAGCDKRFETCRVKFGNLLNFRGFPDIPGDDWSISDPVRAGRLHGGSRRA